MQKDDKNLYMFHGMLLIKEWPSPARKLPLWITDVKRLGKNMINLFTSNLKYPNGTQENEILNMHSLISGWSHQLPVQP